MELNVIQVVGETPGPTLLITGGVHGDEFEPILACRRLASCIDKSSLRGEVWLIPVVNEPAFLRGSRVGEDGLDLARTCPGDPEGSPTERIAHTLSQWIRRADYYIDLHTGGTELSVLPFTGYKMHSDPTVLKTQREMARAFNLPIIWGTDPNLEGRTLSVARDAGIPTIYAEYLGGARCDPDGVQAYVTGCLQVLDTLGMSSSAPYPTSCEHWVEDNRPGSGHMQVCHQSPATGFFEAAVRLGERVEQGQLLGTVTPLAGDPIPVLLEQSGLILVLHTFCRVREGVGLAVVLETDKQREGK